MKSNKPQKQQKANTILAFAKNMDKFPTPLLVQSLNGIIQMLSRRGIKIRDWDDREKAVHGFKCFGSSVFLLAPREKSGTEGDADGQSGKPGNKRTPDFEKISTAVLQNQEAAGNHTDKASESAPGIPGRS